MEFLFILIFATTAILFIPTIFVLIILNIIRSIKLHRLGSKIHNTPTNDLVIKYIKTLNSLVVNNHPNSWQTLRNVFFTVFNSPNISIELKKALYTTLFKKGCNLGNFKFPESTKEELIRKSGIQGENTVNYVLKWLPKEYKVLSNIRLNSSIESQEFDNIIIGPKGIFHIETKNFGGENGCKIKIDKYGNWVKVYNNIEQGLENPEFQVTRHQMVLQEVLNTHCGEDIYKPFGLIVLSNPKTILEGTENSDIPVIKAELLSKFISKFESDIQLSHSEINNIYTKLK